MDYEIYHNSYSGAIAELCKKIAGENFRYSEDEFFNVVSCGGRPKAGETRRETLTLHSLEDARVKHIHFQVYNRETDRKTYELNMYIL